MREDIKTTFRPKPWRLTGTVCVMFATSVFFILGYFGIVDQTTSATLKLISLICGLGILTLFLRVAIFTPTLFEVDDTGVSFKKLLSVSTVKISTNTVEKVHVCWRRDAPFLSLGRKQHLLYSMTIYISLGGSARSYYLFLLPWEPLPDHKMVDELKRSFPSKVVETTKNKFYLLG